MKYLIIILLFLCACSEPRGRMWESESVVLNKDQSFNRGGSYNYLYLYNGESSSWYQVTPSIYAKYEVGDSIHMVVLELISSDCDTSSHR